MVISLSYVKVNALYFLSSLHENEFPLHLVEPPLGSFYRHTSHYLVETVVVSFNNTTVKISQSHFIVVLGIRHHTANTELQATLVVGSFQYGRHLMSIERPNFVRKIQINGWIFLCYNIDSPAQCRTAKLVRDDTFIYFYAFNHVCRNIVQCHEVAELRHRRLVNVHTHSLSF